MVRILQIKYVRGDKVWYFKNYQYYRVFQYIQWDHHRFEIVTRQINKLRKHERHLEIQHSLPRGKLDGLNLICGSKALMDQLMAAPGLSSLLLSPGNAVFIEITERIRAVEKRAWVKTSSEWFFVQLPPVPGETQLAQQG